ncbi:MAG: redox-regulated ATPase YchF [Candidatus Kerfeldbacteria bacterium]|nr:redox-regulated ATPase YchF [Candidatus Kerfeldbacteria bacterium]
MKIGIVGLPNVGKSTLFRALTRKAVPAENYPFCTIDPNIGVVPVPDARLHELARMEHSKEIIPTVVEFVDIAGLVKNAHKGEGLGNQFLSHIREVDAICHVVRFFENDDIIHVEGSVDPVRDVETITTELAMADLQLLEKVVEKVAKEARAGIKEALVKHAGLQKIVALVREGQPAREAALTDDERAEVKQYALLTMKPMLVVVNVDDAHAREPNLPDALRALSPLVLSVKTEAELSDLPREEAQEYLHELGVEQSGLDRLITASYMLLNLLTFFTAGEKETRAWTITHGALAPQAAGVIHTDFEKGFIRAEVVSYEDMLAAGSWNAAKEAGRLHIEGKEYVMHDGDVVHFRFA